jgi:hypothetical protein
MMTNDLRDILREELAPIRAEIETIKVQISGLPLMAAELAGVGDEIRSMRDEMRVMRVMRAQPDGLPLVTRRPARREAEMTDDLGMDQKLTSYNTAINTSFAELRASVADLQFPDSSRTR